MTSEVMDSVLSPLNTDPWIGKFSRMNVQVPGDVAVVQARVTEKRIQDGKDISGQFAWISSRSARADG